MDFEEHEKERRGGVGLREVLVAVAVTVALGTGVAAGFGALSGGADALAPLFVALYGALLAGIAAGILAGRKGFASVGLVGTTWRWVLIGVGFAFLSRLLTFVLVPIYILLTGDATNPQRGLFRDFLDSSALQLTLFALAIGLLAPFAEELFFRGLLFGWLRRWGFWLAALASAGLFGLAHGVNVVLPASFALGLLNAIAYERSGSIWPAVVSHATFNATSLLALLALSLSDAPGL